MAIDQTKKYTATITTSMGVMKLDLFASETPNTVNSFVFLAKEHFYDGLKFHRVIKNFMIQGGDPRGNGTGGPGYSFRDEPVKRQYVRGTLAMANSGPNTNGSQFFIVHQNYPLPPNYTIFGMVTEGFETLDKIATTQTNSADAPVNNMIIQSITITES